MKCDGELLCLFPANPSNEVMAASEPNISVGEGVQPVFLVRDDGQVIVPTGLKYPPTYP